MNPCRFLWRNMTHAHPLKTLLANRISKQKDTYLYFISRLILLRRLTNSSMMSWWKRFWREDCVKNHVSLTADIYNNQQGFMKTGLKQEYITEIKRGVGQGWVLSPLLFNTYRMQMRHTKFQPRLSEDIGLPVYNEEDSKDNLFGQYRTASGNWKRSRAITNVSSWKRKQKFHPN